MTAQIEEVRNRTRIEGGSSGPPKCRTEFEIDHSTRAVPKTTGTQAKVSHDLEEAGKERTH